MCTNKTVLVWKDCDSKIPSFLLSTCLTASAQTYLTATKQRPFSFLYLPDSQLLHLPYGQKIVPFLLSTCLTASSYTYLTATRQRPFSFLYLPERTASTQTYLTATKQRPYSCLYVPDSQCSNLPDGHKIASFLLSISA